MEAQYRPGGDLSSPSMHYLPVGHACCVVDSGEEQAHRVAGSVEEGLAAGERVVVVQGSDGNEVVLAALRRRGIDVDTAVAEGRLLLLLPEDVYLIQGTFDIERRMAAHTEFIEQSVAEGYSGVRLASDAHLALGVFGDIDALVAYEQRVDDLCRTVPVSGTCFYDRTVFGPALVSLVAAHSEGAVDTQLAGRVEPGVARVRGDVDISNVDLFEALLAGAVTDGNDVVVDLHALSFIDLAGTTALLKLSRRLAPERRVKVLSPPRLLFTMLEAIGLSPNLDLVAGEAAA